MLLSCLVTCIYVIDIVKKVQSIKMKLNHALNQRYRIVSTSYFLFDSFIKTRKNGPKRNPDMTTRLVFVDLEKLFIGYLTSPEVATGGVL